MDGIDALRAMKEGKTVVMYRGEGKNRSADSFYRFDHKYTYDTMEYSKVIWTKFRSEKYWHKCENPASFWILADNFEIVEDVLI